jgi:hypothetical protein
MNNTSLEQYYENIILPQYSSAVTFKSITWKDHGKVGLDAWAHYFENENGREYVLLYEDFPGNDYLNDELTHEIVVCGDSKTLHVALSTDGLVDNVVGYFTLYQELQESHI